MRATIAFLLLGFAPLVVTAQVYKWVDDKGRTHYSETPPPDKKDGTKKVEAGPAVAPSQAPRDERKPREMDGKKGYPDKKQADAAAAKKKVADDARLRESHCRLAQTDLSVSEKQGKAIETARARREVEAYCK